jgi:hypothetical protein
MTKWNDCHDSYGRSPCHHAWYGTSRVRRRNCGVVAGSDALDLGLGDGDLVDLLLVLALQLRLYLRGRLLERSLWKRVPAIRTLVRRLALKPESHNYPDCFPRQVGRPRVLAFVHTTSVHAQSAVNILD